MGLYRILIVDDEEESILPVQAVLKRSGYDVLSAGDGWEGIARARASRPDLILLDVKMPQMDGWTFMKFVRSHPDIAAVPVIFLTGATSDEDRKRGMRLGAADYLKKPVDYALLKSTVAAVLDRGGVSATETFPADLAGPREGFRMTGRLDQLGLAALLSLLGAGRRTGVLDVIHAVDGFKGRIVLREGRASAATLDGRQRSGGLEALEVIGQWRDGDFAFASELVATSPEPGLAVPSV